jgi:hypothetical protein
MVEYQQCSYFLRKAIKAPQGCVLRPLLYSLFTHDCMAMHTSNSIKCADDTPVVGLISNNDEIAYREEVRSLVEWSLNVNKMKELIMDFRKHIQDRSGEGGKLQVPRHTHH